MTIATDSARLTVKPAIIPPGRRNDDWPPENLLIKWRGQAGDGFNPVNRVFALTLTVETGEKSFSTATIYITHNGSKGGDSGNSAAKNLVLQNNALDGSEMRRQLSYTHPLIPSISTHGPNDRRWPGTSAEGIE